MNEWYQRFLDWAGVPSKSKHISTSYGKSHVLTIGDSSNPPLVCLHSMLTSSAHLVSELAALSDAFYIIAPDIPGQSVKGLPVRLSYKDSSHSLWLKDVLDGLSPQHVHLLAVSLGGFVARQFASENPDRVASLVLIVPAGIVEGSFVKGFAKMALPMMLYNISSTDNNLRKLGPCPIRTWSQARAPYPP